MTVPIAAFAALCHLLLFMLFMCQVSDAAYSNCNLYSPAASPVVLTEFSGNFTSQGMELGMQDALDSTYVSNSNCAWVIQPTLVQGTSIPFVLTFPFFQTEVQCDYVNIYAGATIDPANLLSSVSGSSIGTYYFNNDTIATNTFPNVTTVTVQFTSDGSVTLDGFSAVYYVSNTSSIPAANITAVPSLCGPFNCNGHGTCVNNQYCVCDAGYSLSDCRQDDLFILSQIYNSCSASQWSTFGIDWFASPSDDFAFCNWSGLSCYSYTVTLLSMPQNNMSCLSAIGVSQLSLRRFPKYVNTVNFSGNAIGSLPSRLDTNIGLLQVDFQATSLTTVPATVGEAGALTYLDISWNNLVGSIQPLLQRLTQVTFLNLANNNFGGFVPADFQLLQPGSVYLDGNSLWCPLPTWPSLASGSCVNVTLDALSVNASSQAGGYNITVVGKNLPFSYSPVCMFGNVPSPLTVGVSSTSILCTVPNLPAQVTSLAVYSQGTQASINSLKFLLEVSCPAGTYATNETMCLLCPKGGTCLGGQQMPTPQLNWVRAQASAVTFLPCFSNGACLGEIINGNQSPSNQTPVIPLWQLQSWTPVCAAGHSGPQCVSCASGWYFSNMDCFQCTSLTSAWIVAATVAGLFLICAAILYLAAQASRFSTTFVILASIQYMGLFYKYQVQWSPQMLSALTAFSVFDINLDEIGLECAFGLTYFSKFDLLLALPLVGAFTLGVYWSSAVIYYRLKFPDAWREKATNFYLVLVRGAILIIYLLHIPLTESAFNMFLCASNADRSYLVPRPDFDCYTPAYYVAAQKAAVMIGLYGFGIPIAFFATTFSFRKKLYNPNVVSILGGMYHHYRSNFCYWESAHLFVHLFVLAAPFVFNSNATSVVFAVTAVLLIYGCLVTYWQPFRFQRSNLMCLLGLSPLPIVLMAGLIPSSNIGSFGTATFTWAYYTLCGLILVHGILYEIQFGFYNSWISKHPKSEKFLKSRAFLFLFPSHADKETLDYINLRRGSVVAKNFLSRKSGLVVAPTGVPELPVTEEARHLDADTGVLPRPHSSESEPQNTEESFSGPPLRLPSPRKPAEPDLAGPPSMEAENIPITVVEERRPSTSAVQKVQFAEDQTSPANNDQ